jgi:hypothetical protein
MHQINLGDLASRQALYLDSIGYEDKFCAILYQISLYDLQYNHARHESCSSFNTYDLQFSRHLELEEQ